MPPLPPIRCEITVPVDPERAFTVFTDGIVAWWPLEQMNVLGAGTLVSFEDDLLVEANLDGAQAVWAEVSEREPGRRLSLAWHPGTDAVSQVNVAFSPHEDGTQVVLEHGGWETSADPSTARAEYEPAWPLVLSRYRAQFPSAGEPDPAETPGTETPGTEPTQARPAETWVALMHTPGPTAPTEGSLFADPRFAEHIAFLQRMSAQGYLIAAGPLTASDGSGMTILRMPGADRLVEVIRLANVEDGAVASGLLAVSVRPWDVMFHGLD